MISQDNTNSFENPQEEIYFQEERSLHHYRTEIPNCVLEAKLDPYSLLVYIYIKRIAGDNGKCFMSIPKLSENCGVSETKLKESLHVLCEKNSFLKMPLLKKTLRKKDDGSFTSSIYTIVDLWPFNMQFFSVIKEKIGGSQYDPGVGRNTTGGGSPRDPKEELIYKKEQDEEEERAGARSSSSDQIKEISLNYDHKKFTSIDPELLDFWKKTYDKIDILNELRQCLVKALTLEKRSDWTSFILNWMQNSQNSSKEVVKKYHAGTNVEKTLREFVQNNKIEKFHIAFHSDRMEYVNISNNFARVIFYDTLEFLNEFNLFKKNLGI